MSNAVYDDRVEIENLGTLQVGFTLDDMMKPHISHAQNPLIALIMYYRKYLETWERGIELMNNECALAGVPKPEFKVSGGCFKATFVRNDHIGNVATEVNDRAERGVNKLTETMEKFSTSFPQILQLQYLRLRRLCRCQERTPTNIRRL